MNEETEDFLEHFGVKGMKWGVKKAATPRAEGYTNPKYKYDRQMYGKGHAKRVNQLMLEGKDLKAARQASHEALSRRNVKIGSAVLGMYVLASIAPSVLGAAAPSINRGLYNLDKKAGDIAFNRFAKDGMKKASNILADSRGLTSYETIAGEFLKNH